MTINHALQNMMISIPGCVTAGYVDLSAPSAVELSSSTADSDGQLELLAVTASDLFREANLAEVWGILDAPEMSDPVPESCEEIVVLSRGWLHVFVRSAHDHRALIAVCRTDVDLGSLLPRLRRGLEELTRAA